MKADTDHNNFVSEEELKESLQEFGLKTGKIYSDEEIKSRVELFDINKDGYISKDEFLFKMKEFQNK